MRNVLLAVTGLTPQVLTETLYYYTQVAEPPVAFDEVRVLTTAEGKRRIQEALLDSEQGHFHRFCRDYGVKGVRFDESCIEVIGGTSPLSDIRTIEDNGRMAAHILATVKKLSAAPSAALYCSIAGGRKTMGAYLALALQLYGRSQDRLSHVLVSPEFESCPDFYYKPPNDRIVTGRDTTSKSVALNTRDARIELANIPFVSVRRYLPRSTHFPLNELVRNLQASVEGPRKKTALRLDLKKKKLWVNDAAVGLAPKLLAVYAFFLNAKKQCRKKTCRGCSDCFLSMNDLRDLETVQTVLALYRKITGPLSGQYERVVTSWAKNPPDEQYFQEAISKINNVLRQAVEELDYPLVEIASTGGYGEKRYGIRLDRGCARM